jgi:hypothetical protein
MIFGFEKNKTVAPHKRKCATVRITINPQGSIGVFYQIPAEKSRKMIIIRKSA